MYRVIEAPVKKKKIPAIFFLVEFDKLILNFVFKYKGPKIANVMGKNKQKEQNGNTWTTWFLELPWIYKNKNNMMIDA